MLKGLKIGLIGLSLMVTGIIVAFSSLLVTGTQLETILAFVGWFGLYLTGNAITLYALSKREFW